MTRNELIQAFLQQSGWHAAQRSDVAGDASNRRYERLTKPDGQTAILMDAPPAKGEDVKPFIKIAKYLIRSRLSAPEIYDADAENGFLLIEDLGDALFARLMQNDPDNAPKLYQAATDLLIELHQKPVPDLPVCDADWLANMTAPVYEFYAKNSGDSTLKFRDAFYPLFKKIDQAPKVVILRDYHAENLLWLEGRSGTAQVGLLDFQDALLGHPAYDLVSILQDARRDVPSHIEQAMIQLFVTATGQNDEFRLAYAVLGIQRNLRILGIFARLSGEGKSSYVDFIPRVWGYLLRNLSHHDLANAAKVVFDTIPEPTPEFLKQLKANDHTS